ncbi:indole-3-glycerol phosphate synthase TrpC [Paenibacillus alvei]|uniref:Indole-3-glycerol phosphate synthase n=1 Tax=Paenibacillus alvei TaxID=44250 RepID=A0ABT4GT24_PAEAL|nr:indole-3-glycerol phosphate synthase TrpC [Paenibacillus alvei]EJW18149.1 indole-3-glycerol phosphate synthase TrpC [Paenibacillus alvei DSM 29]MCY9544028.1 indole-3-glycerol phosphate synthase TrpC [Paenibacillus alvei]MCY9703640.1 indole-3-glycerol phosphate synthase TrpC [Paenibacillus alvei]MCY9732521.1 indole-3-glycerol phosphate synthase TrpC [Paenibacillus alvei]MCY9754421.1 indole-3-glycerol phosphate synthase TrpC [Paenibacillus alvei]
MFLERIVRTKEEEVQTLRQVMNRIEAEKMAAELPPCRGFIDSLTANKNRSVALIAEVKKASPSKGLIRQHFDPAEIVAEYEAAGADALSVLTDQVYFQGGSEILQQVRALTDLPILRKEFIIDELQLFEARLLGADAVLLIAAILSDNQLRHLHDTARQLGMDVLVEVHDKAEMERVGRIEGIKLIGINNRNLHTFETDIEQTNRIRHLAPTGCILVSESGIHLPAHIHRMDELDVDAVLVGEHFMRQKDIKAAVEQLMSGLLNPNTVI